METILWRGILLSGHEACRIYHEDSGWHVDRTAVLFKAGTTDSELPKAGRAVLDRYESGNWSFVADLWVNPVGFVFDYPGIWMLEGEE